MKFSQIRNSNKIAAKYQIKTVKLYKSNIAGIPQVCNFLKIYIWSKYSGIQRVSGDSDVKFSKENFSEECLVNKFILAVL